MADTNLPIDEQQALDAKNARDNPVMGQGGEGEGDSDECSDDEEPEWPGYKEMFIAEKARPFLGKSWMTFSAFFSVYYLVQFGLALTCANFYSQSHELRLTSFEYEQKVTTLVKDENQEGWKKGETGDKEFRMKSVTKDKTPMPKNVPLAICGPGSDADVIAQLKKDIKDKKRDVSLDVAQRQVSANVYDRAFLLMGLFHIIEWLRTICLIASTVMGGVFLLVIYQLTAVNAIFGFVAYVFAHWSLFNVDGVACKDLQGDRSQFLFAEIIFFYVIYGISILFVLAYPKVAFELAHGAWRRREAKRKSGKSE